MRSSQLLSMETGGLEWLECHCHASHFENIAEKKAARKSAMCCKSLAARIPGMSRRNIEWRETEERMSQPECHESQAVSFVGTNVMGVLATGKY